MPLDDIEICSLLGNICSNAIEACQKNTKNNIKTYIRLIIHSENVCDNIFNIKDDTFLTTKKDPTNHGLGLKRIKTIVENAGGFMKIETPKNLFKIDIVLPLTISNNK